MVAGAADEIVEAGAFSAEDEDAVATEVELVVVGCAALIEADNPDVLFFQFLQSADEIDDAGYAEVFGGSGAGFYGYGAQWRSTALGENYAVYSGAVGYAEKRSKILWIFDAIEGEEQAWLRRIGGGEEVFNRQCFLRADESYDSLMSSCASKMRKVFAGFLAHAHAGLFAVRDEAREAVVVSLGGDNDVIEAAPAGLECFSHRMYAV
jgi:hypothetical protein